MPVEALCWDWAVCGLRAYHIVLNRRRALDCYPSLGGASEVGGVESGNVAPVPIDALGSGAVIYRVDGIVRRLVTRQYVLVEDLPLRAGVVRAVVAVVVVDGGAVKPQAVGARVDHTAAEPRRHARA